MYAPQVTPDQAGRFTIGAESGPGLLCQAVTRYGMIGQAQSQASAGARCGGRQWPLLHHSGAAGRVTALA